MGGKAEAYAKELKNWTERLHNVEGSVSRLAEKLRESKERIERLELQKKRLRPSDTGQAANLDRTIANLHQQQAVIGTNFGKVVTTEEEIIRKLEVALYNFKAYFNQRLRRQS